MKLNGCKEFNSNGKEMVHSEMIQIINFILKLNFLVLIRIIHIEKEIVKTKN